MICRMIGKLGVTEAPAGALLGHDGRAQRRGIVLRAGGADHFAHQYGVFALLVVGVGAHNLIEAVDHERILRGRWRGRGARRGAHGQRIGGKEQLLRLPAGDAVDSQTVMLLEGAHGALRNLVIAAGDLGLVKAQLGQLQHEDLEAETI